MTTAARLSAITAFLCLSACGKALGTYMVSNVAVVSGAAAKRVEPDLDPDPQMLRVEFTSTTDLYRASDGGGSGLYVVTSSCPFQNERPLSVSEPHYNDRQRYDPVTHTERRPIKDSVTGNYAYTTYLRLNGGDSGNPGVGHLEFASYDLRKRPVDLCLRIEHPIMFAITPSQSRVFVIPAAMIRKILASEVPSGRSPSN